MTDLIRTPQGERAALASLTRIVCFVLAVLIAAAGIGPAAVSNTAMAASVNNGDISLTLNSLSPNTLTSDDDLKVSVTVRNTGDVNLADAEAKLSLGTNALDSLPSQQQWQSSSAALSTSQTSSTAVPTLVPGAATTVTMVLPASSINVFVSTTTLPVQVAVSGKQAGKSATSKLNTTTPWTGSTSSFTKMTAQLVVPVTLPADPALFSATGAARFKAWNKAIGPGSAIDKLLSSNPSVPVTWLIDPTVLDPPTAQDSSLPATATLAGKKDTTSGAGSSSTAQTPSGSTSSAPGSSSSEGTTGSAPASATGPSSSSGAPEDSSAKTSTPSAQAPTTVDELAARLRTMLADRPSTQQVWFTPYGDPDLSALTSDHRPKGADALLRRMLTRGMPASLTDLSTTVVAAPVSPLNEASARRLFNAWHDTRHVNPTIVTPNATLTGSATASVSTAARHDTSGRLMFGVDAALSETLGSTAMSDGEAGVAARSRSLAIYQQQPSATRSVLAMGPRSTMSAGRLRAVTDSLKSLPWVQTSAITITGALAKAELSQLQTVAPDAAEIWPQPGQAAVSGHSIATIDQTLGNLSRYAGIVSDGSDLVPAWGRTLDQPASTRWRDQGAAASTLTESGEHTVSVIPTRVSVLPSGTINFFTDSGRITVTVRNDLARTVDGAKIHLTPRSYAIRFKTQPLPVTVDAGSRSGVRVETNAQAAGSVDVYAKLTARNGVTLGAGADHPVKFTINARPTGTWIYWVLGIVAVLIFCYGLARNRKKGTRRRDELARDIQL